MGVGFLATVADQALVGVLRVRPAPVPLSCAPIHSPNATWDDDEGRLISAAGIPFVVFTSRRLLQLTRTTRHRRDARSHTEVAYALTSLSAHDAHPHHISAWLQGHWGIANKLHYVRDETFDQDRSQTRTAGGPQVMATLRNPAISLLRLNEEPNLASARRHHARDPRRPTPDARRPKKLLMAN